MGFTLAFKKQSRPPEQREESILDTPISIADTPLLETLYQPPVIQLAASEAHGAVNCFATSLLPCDGMDIERIKHG